MDVVSRDNDPLLARPRARRSRLSGALVGLLLCALVAGAIVAAIWFWPASKPAVDPAKRGGDTIPVVVAASATRDVPIYLDGLGTVQASNTVTVKPLVDGTLMEVRFKEGDTVQAGDVLAKIDPRLYQATLDQATAKKAQDSATLANARVDLTRYQKLSATAYSSTQQFDTQRALVAQLEAQVAGDQAQIDNAQTQVGYTTVKAPISGRIGLRLMDAGNVVHASDITGLVVITQLQPINVVFTLPQQNLPQVASAMKAGVAETLAVAQGQDGATSRVLDTGTLSVLDNQVDSTTGTIKLKATFPNAQERLWPGGFVGVRLRVRVDKGVVTVPPSAVQRGPAGAYVYVIEPDKAQTDQSITASATPRPETVQPQAGSEPVRPGPRLHAIRRLVTVGHEDEDVSVIRTGLATGEQIVIDGASRLTDGSKITIADASNDVQPTGAQAPGTAGGRRRRPSQ